MSTINRNTIQDWLQEQIEQRTLQDWIIDLGPFAMLILLFIVFGSMSDRFLTYNNIVSNIGVNSAVLLIVALAGTFPILQQSIDLSVASIVTLAGIVTALLANQFGLLAVPVALLAGLVVGTLNGVIFAKFKVPSFLVTLGTLSVINGIALVLSGGRSIPFRQPAIGNLASGQLIPNLQNMLFIALVIYIFAIILARYTKFGRYTYALGENETVVGLSGGDVDRYKILAFSLSGVFCAIAGVLLVARISSGSPGMGTGLLLPSIAAIVMGGTALTGGVGGPHRTILGVMVIAVLRNGMNIVGVHPYHQEIVLGLVVVGAVALSIDRRKIDVVK